MDAHEFDATLDRIRLRSQFRRVAAHALASGLFDVEDLAAELNEVDAADRARRRDVEVPAPRQRVHLRLIR